MKKRSIIQIAMTVFFTLMLSSAHAVPVVILDVSSPKINVGNVLEIDVLVKGLSHADSILAFGFDIDVSSGLDFTKAVIGSGLTESSALFPGTDVAAMSFPPLSGGDDIVLASLSFMVLSSGTLEINLGSDISDPNEGFFTTQYPQLDITSSIKFSLAPVPIPGSFTLLGVGLLGVIGYRSRFFFPHMGI
jgi:hypothetical protein